MSGTAPPGEWRGRGGWRRGEAVGGGTIEAAATAAAGGIQHTGRERDSGLQIRHFLLILLKLRLN
ncbi:hypothetical protein E2C01_084143 [Portunus trituberculatus]|uniref:Uncharacterized protein n=1 Tax=Portunus trituberculatus TaxID=210409 RepID=A0A5B7J5I9_PORTR|nr:hypothetical protein [Portunus trituberculatus]